MSHVAPHRWADAAAGKLGEAERAVMERHASTCGTCATARDRITRISQGYPALRTQSSPEVSWDAVRARVHWSVSTERRARFRAPSPRLAMFATAGLAIGVVALGFATGAVHPQLHATAPAIAIVDPKPALPPAPSAITGLVTRLAGEVLIDGVRRDDVFDRMIGAGTVLATADGRIDVQFGDASAFALGPRSELELRKFDADTIELAVEGTVDIELAPRAHHQRFLVIAGDHTVEVRGTQFQVIHDRNGTKVACRHGLVAVRSTIPGSPGSGEVEVGAARKVDLRTGHSIDDARVVGLSGEELAQLVVATPVTTPMWTDADALTRSSAPLEIATGAKRDVRLDGVELGQAPLRVRVMPGRHTVEAADRSGRFRRAGWVDVGATHLARFEVAPVEDVVPTGGIAVRERQLHAGIDQARLKRCTRAIAKAGLTDTYVQIEISVDPSGAVSFLNVIETDLPSSTSSCVREVLADVVFGAGVAATWREKIAL